MIDYVKIYIKAGNGGDGIVGFHREKYVMNGGPDGGDGGNGGNIVFVATKDLNTLVEFKFVKHFRAENGEKGGQKNCTGKSADNLVIRVPTGTVIRDAETERVIADLVKDGQKKTVLKGGRGGKGNARFATPTRQAPAFSQKGEKTIERHIILELKTIADIGLIGFPNVGKSTLLSVLTSARPKIANYHFTTLSPNLGVVKMYDDSMVLADIPGLIEGASEGMGLGHYFLRHIERVRLLVHVVDIAGSEGRDPYEDYLKINAELNNYSEKLSCLPQIVAANKIDLLADKSLTETFAELTGAKVYPVSAAAYMGLTELLNGMYEQFKALPEPEPIEEEYFTYVKEDENAFFTEVIASGIFEVTGGYITKLARNVLFDDDDSTRYFQRKIRERGIIDELKAKGLKEGDTVIIGDLEFEYFE
ncbi:MAG: GTPase ObgE [Clostridiaceae bacterium]|jgi:GTP-binding protein|nr:GTPase ObgE [Clostridiaceae bacterium]